jgi:hypothetical protein
MIEAMLDVEEIGGETRRIRADGSNLGANRTITRS